MKQHIPNGLTLLRYLLVPCLIACWFAGDVMRWWPLAVFVLASVTDFFDGYLARKWRVESELGRMLDPNADKLLVAAALILLTLSQEAPALAVIIIICRELFVSGLREFMAARATSIHVSTLAKWKTASQMLACTLLLAAHAYPHPHLLQTGQWLVWAAAILAAVTGIDYTRGAIRSLKR